MIMHLLFSRPHHERPRAFLYLTLTQEELGRSKRLLADGRPNMALVVMLYVHDEYPASDKLLCSSAG